MVQMMLQTNITTRVDGKKIRRIKHNGRDHVVIPSYTLPAGVVMNGGLYTAEEIDAHYETLEGTLAPLGHPVVNGQPVSAFLPESINAHHVGAFNRNVKKDGNRIAVEKWLDVDFARNSQQGRRLLDRIEAVERGEDVPPIHTSVAVLLEKLQPNSDQAARGVQWVAKLHSIDHDAILLDEPGAATPAEGVGMMVNADEAIPLESLSAEQEAASIIEIIKRFFHGRAAPATNQEGTMTPEEQKALVESVTSGVTAAITEAMKPVTDGFQALQANHAAVMEQLTANAKAEESDMRKAVAAKHGEVVANALTGDALRTMYEALEPAGDLAPNSAGGKKCDAPDFSVAID